MAKVLTRSATTKGGRTGRIEAKEGKLTLDMAKPLELGGSENKETNPEEIFAAGYSACFASSLEYLLENAKVDYDSIEVECALHLIMDAKGGGFKFDIDLYVTLDGPDEETKNTFIDKAYGFCPYSKAISGNVDVRIHRQ
ncbi:MAG: Ohr family peroxiredoxin [Thermotogota bacterium]